MTLPKATRAQLARRRLELELTQAQLAARMGITRYRVCQLELGQNNPSLDMVERWCAALGLDVQYEPASLRVIAPAEADTHVSAPAPRPQARP